MHTCGRTGLLQEINSNAVPRNFTLEARIHQCTANAFLCCLSATTMKACFTFLGLVHLFVSCDTVLFTAVSMANLGCGCFCWVLLRSLLLCFSAEWRSAYLAEGSAFRPLWFVFLFFLCSWFAILHDHQRYPYRCYFKGPSLRAWSAVPEEKKVERIHRCMCLPCQLEGCVMRCDRLFFGRRPLPFGGSHLRLPSGPAGIRTTGSLSALARPTPYQLSHRVQGRPSPCLQKVCWFRC